LDCDTKNIRNHTEKQNSITASRPVGAPLISSSYHHHLSRRRLQSLDLSISISMAGMAAAGIITV
jgi:hypothetical protein